MAQKVTKDGFAIDPIGDPTLGGVRRQVFAGDSVPDTWELTEGAQGEFYDDQTGVVYNPDLPYERSARGNLTAADADSSHAGLAANVAAREEAAKEAEKEAKKQRSGTGRSSSASRQSSDD